jgi:type 1 glutamine amidotransferase
MTHHALCTPVSLILALLLVSSTARADDKPLRALLVVGGCCHDYRNQKDVLTKGISARANVQWKIAYDTDSGTSHKNPVYDDADWAKHFDVVVHDECSSDVKDPAVIDTILKPHREGLPGVVLHCAMHCYRGQGFPKSTPWFEFTGLPSTGHGASLPIAVRFVDKENPITKDLEDWTTINEELYNNSAGRPLDTAHALARGSQGKDDFVVVWTNLYRGKARVFGTTLGHQTLTVRDPRYLELVTRGLLWAVGKLDPSYLKPAKKVLLDD